MPNHTPDGGKTNWHWLLQHPVEFSKNKHTHQPGWFGGSLAGRSSVSPGAPPTFDVTRSARRSQIRIAGRRAGREKTTSPEGATSNRPADLHAGDGPLAAAQYQPAAVQQPVGAEPLLGVGDPLVVDVGAALRDGPAGVVQAAGQPGVPEQRRGGGQFPRYLRQTGLDQRSEEHTSELQSQFHLVCRLLLEK